MKLYLMQHGQALSESEDPQRALSQKGKEETQKIADSLKNKGLSPNSIWHSKKLRARQTAEIISLAISCKNTRERDDLNPDDPVAKFTSEIGMMNKDIMIVGHLPFLSKLASLFLTGSEDLRPVSFTYSGILCLERKEKWQVAWFLTPELA